MARWFGRQPRPGLRSDLATRAEMRAWLDSDGLVTPDLYPGLTPEACAFLNTPLEECDPEIACALFSSLAQFIATQLSGQGEPVEAQALFDTIWGRFGPMIAAPKQTQEPARDEAGAGPDALGAEAAPQADATPAPPPAAMLNASADGTAHCGTAHCGNDAASGGDAGCGSDAGYGSTCWFRLPGGPRLAAEPRSFPDSRASPGYGDRRSIRGRQRPQPRRLQARGSPRALPPRRLSYAACAGPP